MTRLLLRTERARLSAECVRRYHAGASLREVAAQVGVSSGTVRRLLLENGTTLRPRGGYQRRRTPVPG